MFRWFLNKKSSRKRRRLAVLLFYLSLSSVCGYFLVAPVGGQTLGRLADLSSVVMTIVCIGIIASIRGSVQNLADVNDRLLDERQQRVRDRTYRHAYAILSLVLSFVLLSGALALMAGLTPSFPSEGALFWIFLVPSWLTLTLPTMIIAWNEPDPEDEA